MGVEEIACLIYCSSWSPIQRELLLSFIAATLFGLLPLALVVWFSDDENLREEGEGDGTRESSRRGRTVTIQEQESNWRENSENGSRAGQSQQGNRDSSGGKSRGTGSGLGPFVRTIQSGESSREGSAAKSRGSSSGPTPHVRTIRQTKEENFSQETVNEENRQKSGNSTVLGRNSKNGSDGSRMISGRNSRQGSDESRPASAQNIKRGSDESRMVFGQSSREKSDDRNGTSGQHSGPSSDVSNMQFTKQRNGPEMDNTPRGSQSSPAHSLKKIITESDTTESTRRRSHNKPTAETVSYTGRSLSSPPHSTRNSNVPSDHRSSVRASSAEPERLSTRKHSSSRNSTNNLSRNYSLTSNSDNSQSVTKTVSFAEATPESVAEFTTDEAASTSLSVGSHNISKNRSSDRSDSEREKVVNTELKLKLPRKRKSSLKGPTRIRKPINDSNKGSTKNEEREVGESFDEYQRKQSKKDSLAVHWKKGGKVKGSRSDSVRNRDNNNSYLTNNRDSCERITSVNHTDISYQCKLVDSNQEMDIVEECKDFEVVDVENRNRGDIVDVCVYGIGSDGCRDDYAVNGNSDNIYDSINGRSVDFSKKNDNVDGNSDYSQYNVNSVKKDDGDDDVADHADNNNDNNKISNINDNNNSNNSNEGDCYKNSNDNNDKNVDKNKINASCTNDFSNTTKIHIIILQRENNNDDTNSNQTDNKINKFLRTFPEIHDRSNNSDKSGEGSEKNSKASSQASPWSYYSKETTEKVKEEVIEEGTFDDGKYDSGRDEEDQDSGNSSKETPESGDNQKHPILRPSQIPKLSNSKVNFIGGAESGNNKSKNFGEKTVCCPGSDCCFKVKFELLKPGEDTPSNYSTGIVISNGSNVSLHGPESNMRITDSTMSLPYSSSRPALVAHQQHQQPNESGSRTQLMRQTSSLMAHTGSQANLGEMPGSRNDLKNHSQSFERQTPQTNDDNFSVSGLSGKHYRQDKYSQPEESSTRSRSPSRQNYSGNDKSYSRPEDSSMRSRSHNRQNHSGNEPQKAESNYSSRFLKDGGNSRTSDSGMRSPRPEQTDSRSGRNDPPSDFIKRLSQKYGTSPSSADYKSSGIQNRGRSESPISRNYSERSNRVEQERPASSHYQNEDRKRSSISRQGPYASHVSSQHYAVNDPTERYSHVSENRTSNIDNDCGNFRCSQSSQRNIHESNPPPNISCCSSLAKSSHHMNQVQIPSHSNSCNTNTVKCCCVSCEKPEGYKKDKGKRSKRKHKKSKKSKSRQGSSSNLIICTCDTTDSKKSKRPSNNRRCCESSSSSDCESSSSDCSCSTCNDFDDRKSRNKKSKPCMCISCTLSSF